MCAVGVAKRFKGTFCSILFSSIVCVLLGLVEHNYMQGKVTVLRGVLLLTTDILG